MFETIPTGDPIPVEIPTLSQSWIEKLAITFGTLEKATNAVKEYTSLPR